MSQFKINAELGKCALCEHSTCAGGAIHAMFEKNKRLLITEVIRSLTELPMRVNATYEQLEGTDPQPETITIFLGWPRDFIHRKQRCYPAFCFHDLCWAIFLQILSNPPIRACYDITLAINKLSCLRRLRYKYHSGAPSVFYKPQTIERGYQEYLSRRTRSSFSDPDILLSIRHLPYELRVHIWSYLNSSDQVARALVVLLRLSDHIQLEDRHCQGPSSKIHLGELELSCYTFPTISSWLQCIHVEPLGIATCHGKIDISPPIPISAIELINNGSAIRFYTGDDKTGWLGKVPVRSEDCWYRFIHNKENSGSLYLEGRDRITSIGFESKNDMVLSTKAFGSDFEWQPPLSRSEVYPEESYFTHEGWDDYPTPRRHYSTKVRHVRFQREGYRLDRITMFLNHGIRGFECVFQKEDDTDVYDTQFTGQRTPHLLNLQLDQGEVITHVWVARETKRWASLQEEFSPGSLGLYLGTSFGRVESFNDTKYRDIHCLTSQKEHAVVTGIYWNNDCSYGVTFAGQPQMYPHIPDPNPDIVSWEA